MSPAERALHFHGDEPCYANHGLGTPAEQEEEKK